MRKISKKNLIKENENDENSANITVFNFAFKEYGRKFFYF